MRVGPEIDQAVQRARRYIELRERLVEVDPEMCGVQVPTRGPREAVERRLSSALRV